MVSCCLWQFNFSDVGRQRAEISGGPCSLSTGCCVNRIAPLSVLGLNTLPWLPCIVLSLSGNPCPSYSPRPVLPRRAKESARDVCAELLQRLLKLASGFCQS